MPATTADNRAATEDLPPSSARRGFADLLGRIERGDHHALGLGRAPGGRREPTFC